jgi:hypothetical protein
MDTTKTDQPSEQKPAAPQLGMNDLAAVVQMIDIVSRRGAFEGTELTAVGALRAKFADFVQANAPKPAAAADAEATVDESNTVKFPGSSEEA